MAYLARRLTNPGFVRPTLALAAATAALSAGAEILPGLSAKRSIGPLVTGTTVSLLAPTAALTQPRAEVTARHRVPTTPRSSSSSPTTTVDVHGRRWRLRPPHTTLSKFRQKSDRRTVPRH